MTNYAHTRTLRYTDRFPKTDAIALDEVGESGSDEAVDDLKALAVQLRAATAARIPVVYGLLRVETPVVKIGFSTHLADRTGRKRGFKDSRLVTLTPGGRDEERQVHGRLAEYRLTVDLPGSGNTEHFQIVQPVVDWINETRTALNLIPVSMDDLLAYSRQAA